MWQRGDIWIDWIAVTTGKPKVLPERADVCSELVVPRIQLPGISQQDFNDAFKVLDECIITDTPVSGFNYPVMAPGGQYGENWWQLDASLCVAGTKWVNQRFVEQVMRGFAGVQSQNPDGRIDLWGGSPVRGQVADVSSLPRYFEAAFDVARRTRDVSLQLVIYETMKNYLGYWLSTAKRDNRSGLITAVFEETFSNPHKDPGIIAAIDLNVAVAVGCHHTAKIARYLGKNVEAKKYNDEFENLKEKINLYLWNNENKVYYNFYVNKGIHDKRLLCTTFDPLRLGIAPPDRVEKLIPLLTNPVLFNWGVRPVTTIARTEPEYLEATGPYDGSAWFGDVWTLRNLSIIEGLENAGKHKLAAGLAWSTINTFNARYTEYIVPGTGSGEGVQRYGWTASQYIQAVIEHLFGIDYDYSEKRLRIIPHVPDALAGQVISISNLIIPADHDVRISFRILYTTLNTAEIEFNINEPLPDHKLEILFPCENGRQVTIRDNSGKILPALTDIVGLPNITGIRTDLDGPVDLLFENL